MHGYNTQGENIADNGGLRAAFEGYKRRITLSNSMHQRLPGLSDISTDQLFFLGFAQVRKLLNCIFFFHSYIHPLNQNRIVEKNNFSLLYCDEINLKFSLIDTNTFN